MNTKHTPGPMTYSHAMDTLKAMAYVAPDDEEDELDQIISTIEGHVLGLEIGTSTRDTTPQFHVAPDLLAENERLKGEVEFFRLQHYTTQQALAEEHAHAERLRTALKELVEAGQKAHAALDCLMGDSDLPDDDSQEMRACQALIAALSRAKEVVK